MRAGVGRRAQAKALATAWRVGFQSGLCPLSLELQREIGRHHTPRLKPEINLADLRPLSCAAIKEKSQERTMKKGDTRKKGKVTS